MPGTDVFIVGDESYAGGQSLLEHNFLTDIHTLDCFRSVVEDFAHDGCFVGSSCSHYVDVGDGFLALAELDTDFRDNATCVADFIPLFQGQRAVHSHDISGNDGGVQLGRTPSEVCGVFLREHRFVQ